MDFIVSPWEENSVDFLVENGAKAIKLASIDNSNYQFCEYIADKGLPTIISTGMSGYENINIINEILKTDKDLEKEDKDILRKLRQNFQDLIDLANNLPS